MLLYVQEFGENSLPPNRGCVYISYLDSVPFLRPRALRTTAYHALLDGYWRHARARGYHACHLWACPSSRNQPFILHAHPPWQRIPSAERLRKWYMTAIKMGCDDGIVSRTTNLHDEFFPTYRPFVNLRARPGRKQRPKPTLMVRLKYIRDPIDPTGQTLRFFAHTKGLRKVNRIVAQLCPPPVSPPSHRGLKKRGDDGAFSHVRRRNLDEVPVFTEHFWVEEAERILSELEQPPLTRGSVSKIERLARRWWAAVRAEAAAESALCLGVGDGGSGAGGSESDGGALRTPRTLDVAAIYGGRSLTLARPAAAAAAAAALPNSHAHSLADVKAESRASAPPLRPPPLALTRVLGSASSSFFPSHLGLDESVDDLDDELTDDEKSSVVEWFMSRLAAKIKPMRDGFFMLDLTKAPSPVRARSGSTVGEGESGGGSGASGGGSSSSTAASAAVALRKSGTARSAPG